ncbi:caspase recruitment domain-containing protein 19-like [Salarias fasciatus]|uniref:caspase recruitment domain-containing protein 19-like n=1 Tax=Salarias fasciatus TaxID=181472 RepID=UPI001176C287|nr:caspase recruitment domain-containing protein 19-like [Salarias fasciatus]
MELLLLSVSSQSDLDIDGFHEQLQNDAHFLCSDGRMDAELVDQLVLQLNRIYPQILSDKEAHRFRNLSVPIEERVFELLEHLYGEGEEACHEFYRALQIHAEDVYSDLPTTMRRRETEEPTQADAVAVYEKQYVLNDKGPMFFLSCFSVAVGIAVLFYYGDGETFRCTGGFQHCSAARLSTDAFVSYAHVGKQK